MALYKHPITGKNVSISTRLIEDIVHASAQGVPMSPKEFSFAVASSTAQVNTVFLVTPEGVKLVLAGMVRVPEKRPLPKWFLQLSEVQQAKVPVKPTGEPNLMPAIVGIDDQTTDEDMNFIYRSMVEAQSPSRVNKLEARENFKMVILKTAARIQDYVASVDRLTALVEKTDNKANALIKTTETTMKGFERAMALIDAAGILKHPMTAAA